MFFLARFPKGGVSGTLKASLASLDEGSALATQRCAKGSSRNVRNADCQRLAVRYSGFQDSVCRP
jgi:hypothetical protein